MARTIPATFVVGLTLAGILAGPPVAHAGFVFSCVDSGLPGLVGELRSTIAAAVAGETITIQTPGCAITLVPANGPVVIDKNLTIVGSTLGPSIIDGANGTRVFTIQAGKTVTIDGVTIRNGRHGGAATPGRGGAINNAGTLTLANSVVSGNTVAPVSVDIPDDGRGGGIYNTGTLTLTNSAVSGNTAAGSINAFPIGGSGGGIYNTGTLTLGNSTVSGNTAANSVTLPLGSPGTGGGIRNLGTLTVVNSTITGNTAGSSTALSGQGGGIANTAGTTSILNSTVAANNSGLPPIGGFGIELSRTTGSVTVRNTIVGVPSVFAPLVVTNCSGTITSLGHNVDSGTSCGFGAAGDVSGVDPRLGVLQDNGGGTSTMALRSGSPAIDGGDAGACPAADQRGVVRLDGGSGAVVCDIGAFEFRTPIAVTGAGTGGAAHVRVFSASSGNEVFGFFAYDVGFTGGVRVATGDVNGDGYADVVTGAGVGGGPHVQVFDGLALLRHQVVVQQTFMALDTGFTGGIFVDAADLNGDGKADILVGAGAGGGPAVRVFDGLTGAPFAGPLGYFFAYSLGYTGGVFVAGAP